MTACPTCGTLLKPNSAQCPTCERDLTHEFPTLRAPLPESRVGQFSIGRNPASDIVLNRRCVSWDHATLIVDPSGRVVLQDLNSSNGTYFNTQSARVETVELKAGDSIYFGDLPVASERLLEAISQPGKGSGHAESVEFPLGKSEMIFGRSGKADYLLDHTSVSWNHACIRRDGDGRFFLRDMGSTNGTFYEGLRAGSSEREIHPGAEIRIGVYILQLGRSGTLEKRNDARDITVEIRNIPNGISFVAEPGELVAIIGERSHALLDNLRGAVAPLSGHIVYSGRSLYHSLDCFRSRIGYVSRLQAVHSNLPRADALAYVARLRLPASATAEHIDDRVRAAIDQAGLRNVEDSWRLSLAVELLTDATVLLVDGVPTKEAAALLRRQADGGKTVIVGFDKPPLLEVFEKFHTVAVITATEELLYYGPASAALEFFDAGRGKSGPAGSLARRAAPEDMLAAIGLRGPEYFKDKFHQAGSPKGRFVDQRLGQVPQQQQRLRAPPTTKNRLAQLATLAFRMGHLAIRSRWYQLNLILPVLVVAIGALANKLPEGSLNAAALWTGLSPATFEIAGEREIYRRERMANLSLASYLVSKVVMLFLPAAIQCAVMFGIVKWAGGLPGVTDLTALWLLALAGLAVGLFVSALLPGRLSALIALPVLTAALLMGFARWPSPNECAAIAAAFLAACALAMKAVESRAVIRAAASVGLKLGVFALVVPAFAIEPKVTRAAYSMFTDPQEAVLGKKFAEETDRRIISFRDAVLVEYIEGIVKKLGERTQRPKLTYRVTIVDSPQINAFSQPGGYIYVYRGLLNMAWNEGELAGMLAHEISHVVARHNMNRLSRSEAAKELARRSRVQGVKLELTPKELNAWEGAFSRSEETEADLLGFYTMLRAGWNPSCLITAFEGIRAFTGDPQMISEILATHPAPAERQRYLSEELKMVDPPAALRSDSKAFQLMKDLLRESPQPRGK